MISYTWIQHPQKEEKTDLQKLYLIGGTIGVGKTTVCRRPNELLENSVFLDGDWCWNSSPFQVTEETKNTVIENIRFLLNQFIHCSAYENIVFCRVMHEHTIIDTIISGIDTSSCIVEKISLICEENALKSRLKNDISAGLRKPDVVERSIERLPLYSFFGTRIIDTTEKRVEETTTEIAGI